MQAVGMNIPTVGDKRGHSRQWYLARVVQALFPRLRLLAQLLAVTFHVPYRYIARNSG
jgi:hypothetical protein